MNFLLNSLQDGCTLFLSIVIQAVPFIALGVLVSTLIGHLVTEKQLVRYLPKNRFLALLMACGAGVFLPVCECGNVPVARRLLQKKLPPAVVITFLLASPVMNPLVIFATWSAFRGDLMFVMLRVVFTLAVAMIIGFVFSFHPDPQEMISRFSRNNEKEYSCHLVQKGWKGFLRSYGMEFLEMLAVLIVGAFLASFLQVIVPRQFMLNVGGGMAVSIISMMIFAFVISVCANVDAFIALSYSSTFTSGALLAFLVFGPMIDLKGIFMYRSIFTPKTIALFSLLAFVLIFILTYFYNFLLGS